MMVEEEENRANIERVAERNVEEENPVVIVNTFVINVINVFI